MGNKKVENGFEKLQRQIEKKNSRVVLGIDPTDEEWDKAYNSPFTIDYFKKLINEAAPYVVGIKPNLAFFERSEYRRGIMAQIMKYAGEKGLVKIMDAKRGDITDTQTQMSEADMINFNPDIVTLHSYSGSDAVKPYLDVNPNLCIYIMAAMSNPSAQIQNLTANGLKVAQHVAVDAGRWGQGRVGLVVGATQGEALKHIRMAEKEYGLNPAPVLAPGLGKQGGTPFADRNSVFPISSGLTKEKYLNGMTTGEAAKYWRDVINTEIKKAQEPQSLREYAVNSLIEGGFVKTAKSPDLIKDGFFLKKGKTKLTTAGIVLTGSPDEKVEQLRSLVGNGTLSQDDFAALFVNLRDIMGMTNIEARDTIGHLYTKLVKDSGVKPELVGGVPYGAIFPAMQVAQNLKVPFITERKEADMVHDRIVGGKHDGKQGIIVEDVLTSGGSSIEFAKSLRANGIEVNDVYAFLDRQQGAEENLEKADLTLHAVTDMDSLKKTMKKNPNVASSVIDLI
ncbi:MAG: orotidine-5'-phosphate decarboxylase [Christensenellaceae bacterium]|nr:orotidine-5'-phosphate decarboxylase [Christensenellaceae bacterium]